MEVNGVWKEPNLLTPPEISLSFLDRAKGSRVSEDAVSIPL